MSFRPYFFLAATAGLFLITENSFAGPFSIEPSGDLPTSVVSGETKNALYTITNLTNVNTTRNFVKYLPPNVTVNTATTTCSPSSSGFSLAAYASCTLGLTVSGAVNSSDPSPQNHLFICMSDRISCAGPTPANSLNVVVSADTVPDASFVMAGQSYEGAQPPILASSINNGQTWSIPTISSLPVNGNFNVTSCSYSGTNSPCVAAGRDNAGLVPLLVASTDSGSTWAIKSISGLSSVNVTFEGAGCAGRGVTGICVVSGRINTTSAPLLVQSTDGGATWSQVTTTTPALPATGRIRSSSCTGSGSTALCVAAGVDNGTGAPLLVQTTDGGANWTRITSTTPALPASGDFFGTSCTGTGSSAICVASGATGSAPLLVITVDGGASWTRVTGSPLPVSGYFDYPPSCTGSGSSAVCAVVGTASNTPLLVVTSNGGSTWTRVTAASPALPAGGYIYGSSCTGSGSTAICTVTGEEPNGSGAPFLSVSTDGGATWALKTVSGLTTTNGYFWPAACTGSGSSAVCVAGGYDQTGNFGFQAISRDGGQSWALFTITGTPTDFEWWAAGASNTASSLKQTLRDQHFGAENTLATIIKK